MATSRAFVWVPLPLLALSACHGGLRHDHSRLHTVSAPIAPGTYDLLLFSTSGRREGERALGRMTLYASSPDDVSPRTGERANPRIDARLPLYGATDLRFEDVNAPILERGPEASPRSTDPIYPGVLVDTDCRHEGQVHTCLWIGSVVDRSSTITLDGAGIVLFVEWMDGPAFGGIWDPAGIVGGDTGTWTAKRLREQPR